MGMDNADALPEVASGVVGRLLANSSPNEAGVGWVGSGGGVKGCLFEFEARLKGGTPNSVNGGSRVTIGGGGGGGGDVNVGLKMSESLFCGCMLRRRACALFLSLFARGMPYFSRE